MEKPNCRFYEFGEFRLDLEERVLLKNGEEIHLTGKVFDLLLYLVQHEGRILEHNEILEAVWPDSFVEQANLKNGISTLRKLMGESPDDNHYIKTVPRRGYRFVAQVKPVIEDKETLVVASRLQYEEIIEEEIVFDDDIKEHKLIETDVPHSMVERAVLPAAETAIDVVKTNTNRAEKKSRKVYLFAVTGFVLLVLTSLGVYQIFLANRPQPPKIENLTLSKLSNTGNVLLAIVTPDGQSVVYGVMDEKGDRSLWTRRVGHKASIQLLPPSPVNFWGWAISPDGNYVYYIAANRATNSGTLYRVPLFGGISQKIAEDVNTCGGFSPDGKRMFIVRWVNEPREVQLISINTDNGGDEKIVATQLSAPNFGSPQWSPDGKKIFYIRYESRSNETFWSIVERPADGTEEREILSSGKTRIWGIAWLKDVGGFVMNAMDPETNLAQLYYVSYPDGAVSRLTNDLSFYFGVSVSDDGKIISAAQRRFENDIRVVKDGKTDEAKKITLEPNVGTEIDWTPNGKIVYSAFENNRPHVWIMEADGSNPQQLTPSDSIDINPTVSPDGRYIIFLSKRTGVYRLWRMDIDGRNQKILFDGTDEIAGSQITPDGKTVILSIKKNGKAYLSQISIEGSEMKQLTPIDSEMFALSPDGKFLAHTVFDERQKKLLVVVKSYPDFVQQHIFDISPREILLWSSDGKNLLFNHADTKQFNPAILWQQPVSGGTPKPFLTFKQESFIDVTFSPDGKNIAFIESRLITDAVMLRRK